MSGPSPAEIKRWALDASDWLWGTVQGAWNEKQSTSQIVVDAGIGMVPLVGDVTAVRDLLAVGTGLAQEPQKRDDTMQWVLLVILLFALIPVVGGVIKGVGRLLLRVGKNAAENHAILEETITFLNRVGQGDAIKFIKELDVTRYQRELIAKFNAFCDKMSSTMLGMRDKLGWFVPQTMKDRMGAWAQAFSNLKQYGASKIPEAVKDLNARLKELQKAIYKGEWHSVQPGVKNTTREAEARLHEHYRAQQFSRKPGKYPQNPSSDSAAIREVYASRDGYPSLDKYPKDLPTNDTEATFSSATPKKYHPDISCFSGPIKAREIQGPATLGRVVGIGKKLEVKANNPAGAFWVESKAPPANAERWRHDYAVLDNFNHDSYIIFVDIPPGKTFRAWEGVAAEQFSRDGKQYLTGGSTQLYIDMGLDRATSDAMGKAFAQGAKDFTAPSGLRFRLQETGWPDANGIHGYGQDALDGMSRSERLAQAEYEGKRGQALGAATSTRFERATENKESAK